jgi:hypothetical protein
MFLATPLMFSFSICCAQFLSMVTCCYLVFMLLSNKSCVFVASDVSSEIQFSKFLSMLISPLARVMCHLFIHVPIFIMKDLRSFNANYNLRGSHDFDLKDSSIFEQSNYESSARE